MTWFATRAAARLLAGLAVSCLPVVFGAAAVARSGGDGGSAALPPPARPAPALPAPGGGPLLSRPGVQVLPGAGAPALPKKLSGLSWIVCDARTGQVLAAKDAHRRLPPASTLKTLFADTVLPRFSSTATHKVTDADLAGIGPGSSLVGVQAGQTYTVADLWRGVFLASGNDAVHVLAHMNGSVPRTVQQMQAKAAMLGARDTHVVSPDGYDYPGQLSSAYDLALFGRAGLTNHDFAGYAHTATAQFPAGVTVKGTYLSTFGIRNTNRLLTGAQGVHPYPGLIGVKNGYTTHAGNTLIAAATQHDRTLIVTVMNPQDHVPQAVYTEAASLLDWGFAAAGHTTSVGTLDVAQTSPAASPGARPPGAGQATTTVRAVDNTLPATVWYLGGAVVLVLAAVASILLLRRRAAARGGLPAAAKTREPGPGANE